MRWVESWLAFLTDVFKKSSGIAVLERDWGWSLYLCWMRLLSTSLCINLDTYHWVRWWWVGKLERSCGGVAQSSEGWKAESPSCNVCSCWGTTSESWAFLWSFFYNLMDI
jgi:hypothetical protein